MSIPASLAISKLRYPETEETLTTGRCVIPDDDENRAANSLHAFANGAWLGLKIAGMILATLLCIIAFLGLANGLLTWWGRYLLLWTATISGPDDTPYAGLTFKLSFDFPSNYPYAPPTVLFKTPIYHPNVDFSGRICLDILKDKWSAVYNVQSVLLSLQSLLGEPNK